MPIVDLSCPQYDLRPLVLRYASVNAIDLLLSACCEEFPRYEALKNEWKANIIKYLKNF